MLTFILGMITGAILLLAYSLWRVTRRFTRVTVTKINPEDIEGYSVRL